MHNCYLKDGLLWVSLWVDPVLALDARPPYAPRVVVNGTGLGRKRFNVNPSVLGPTGENAYLAGRNVEEFCLFYNSSTNSSSLVWSGFDATVWGVLVLGDVVYFGGDFSAHLVKRDAQGVFTVLHTDRGASPASGLVYNALWGSLTFVGNAPFGVVRHLLASNTSHSVIDPPRITLHDHNIDETPEGHVLIAGVLSVRGFFITDPSASWMMRWQGDSDNIVYDVTSTRDWIIGSKGQGGNLWVYNRTLFTAPHPPPTPAPTAAPTTRAPTREPTTRVPTTLSPSRSPTPAPTARPTTLSPTSANPTTRQPSMQPTSQPTVGTELPTSAPSPSPTTEQGNGALIGGIVGGVVAIVTIATLIAIVLYMCRSRSRTHNADIVMYDAPRASAPPESQFASSGWMISK